MHKTKLLKLLGISLIVGILGLTGFCNNSGNNSGNNNNLLLGVVVAQQQAAQAAYEAANNTDNPQWFCAIAAKYTSSTNYVAILTPLVAQDCNVNYWGSSTNAIKQRLLETINNDADLSSNCPNTRNAISSIDFSSAPGAPEREKFIYKGGRSLLSEVGLSTTDYTVVSPNTFKLYFPLALIKGYVSIIDTDPNTPGIQPETSCQNAVQNKIDSLTDSNKFCSNTASNPYSLPVCDSNKTKVVLGFCTYGSDVPSNDPLKCATLDDQF